MLAPGVESLMVTVCAVAYVPPGGLNVGIAVGGPRPRTSKLVDAKTLLVPPTPASVCEPAVAVDGIVTLKPLKLPLVSAVAVASGVPLQGEALQSQKTLMLSLAA